MSKQPKPFPSLKRNVGDIKGQQRRQQNSSPFSGTAFSVPAPGVTNVEGDLVFTNGEARSGNFVTDSTGWRLPQNGTPEFNDLKLRGGIIGNDALSAPVLAQGAFDNASGFALSVAGGYVITINKATPAGFTNVVVTAFGRCVGQNSTASVDALYTSLNIHGVATYQYPTTVGAGQGNTSPVGLTTTLTGLSAGENVATSLFVSTGAANWSANPANAADLSVTYSWSR